MFQVSFDSVKDKCLMVRDMSHNGWSMACVKGSKTHYGILSIEC